MEPSWTINTPVGVKRGEQKEHNVVDCRAERFSQVSFVV